jgi:hypothetical protein
MTMNPLPERRVMPTLKQFVIETEIRKCCEHRFLAATVAEAVAQVPNGEELICVNGLLFLGKCVGCGVPLLDGDDQVYDFDAGYFCKPCADRIRESDGTDAAEPVVEEYPT